MKSKILALIKEKKLYLITFFVSSLIVAIIYILNNVTPFGEKSLLCVDFFHQYGPMLGELYDRINGFDNLIYSFNMSMGLPFFRNFFNYLSSPFNIIMFFTSRNNLVTSFSFIIGFKAVFSSITCLYFLIHKFKKRELYFIPISLLYAFSAYFQAYYWNIMWLDGMVFLPLIVAGIENIVDRRKYKLYLFSLAIMMFANYFIAYMICIFSAVYFLIYLFSTLEYKKESIKKNIIIILKRSGLFAFSSIIAAMLVSIFLLPLFSSLTSISATGGDIPTSQYYDFLPLDFIKGHLLGSKKTVFASDDVTRPNIACGILPTSLLLLFIINKNIKLKTKICYLLCLGFLVLAFFFAPLDYILHAFHVPNDLPYRYSFLYTFTLIVIAAISLKNIKYVKYYIVLIIYILLMIGLFLLTKTETLGSETSMIYINMIILTLYFIFYNGYHFQEKFKILFFISIIIVSGIEIVVSTDYNWDITQILSVFYEDYKPTKELLSSIEKDNNELFYRVENTQMLTLNDPSWYNYRGMTSFSSMTYESLAKLHNRLGLPGNDINSFYYAQTTPIYDLMFDLKYIIGNSNDNKRYTPIKTIEETANRFDYNVGLMFGVNNSIKNWDIEGANPFLVQNDFVKLSTGIDNTLKPATLISSEEMYHDENEVIVKYSYQNNFENLYFYNDDNGVNYILIGSSIYYNNDNYDDVNNKVNEMIYNYSESYEEKKVINITSLDEVINIYVSYNIYDNLPLDVYELDEKKFIEAYKVLNKNKVNITSYDEYKLTGIITLNENKTIYTSIPYDEGWNVTIDGKKVSTYKIGGTLLGFDCLEGNHEIKLVYKIPYLSITIPVTLSGIILIVLKETMFTSKTCKRKCKVDK